MQTLLMVFAVNIFSVLEYFFMGKETNVGNAFVSNVKNNAISSVINNLSITKKYKIKELKH